MKYSTIFLNYLIFASFCDNFYAVFAVYGHSLLTGLDKIAALSSVEGSPDRVDFVRRQNPAKYLKTKYFESHSPVYVRVATLSK